jgi:hypothetical protein
MIKSHKKIRIVPNIGRGWLPFAMIFILAFCIFSGCIEIGQEKVPQAPQISPSESPSEGAAQVATQAYITPLPTTPPPFVGSAVRAEPIPPASTIAISTPSSLPGTPPLVRPNEMATATFSKESFDLMYSNVAYVVTVDRAPFVIEFWTSAYSNDPYDSIVIITVRDPATGEMITEDGFNGRYSSDAYKRIIVRDSGQFHVNIYGMRTSVVLKFRGGVNESAAEPYGKMDISLATRESEYLEEGME